jgi:hypothetical protein
MDCGGKHSEQICDSRRPPAPVRRSEKKALEGNGNIRLWNWTVDKPHSTQRFFFVPSTSRNVTRNEARSVLIGGEVWVELQTRKL